MQSPYVAVGVLFFRGYFLLADFLEGFYWVALVLDQLGTGCSCRITSVIVMEPTGTCLIVKYRQENLDSCQQ